MPPLVIEASLALALFASVVRITTAINRIEQNQEVAKSQVLGEIKVIHAELAVLKSDNKEIKAEVRETRRHRFNDKPDL